MNDRIIGSKMIEGWGGIGKVLADESFVLLGSAGGLGLKGGRSHGLTYFATFLSELGSLASFRHLQSQTHEDRWPPAMIPEKLGCILWE